VHRLTAVIAPTKSPTIFVQKKKLDLTQNPPEPKNEREFDM
jgi:hypothetical protein